MKVISKLKTILEDNDLTALRQQADEFFAKFCIATFKYRTLKYLKEFDEYRQADNAGLSDTLQTYNIPTGKNSTNTVLVGLSVSRELTPSITFEVYSGRRLKDSKNYPIEGKYDIDKIVKEIYFKMKELLNS